MHVPLARQAQIAYHMGVSTSRKPESGGPQLDRTRFFPLGAPRGVPVILPDPLGGPSDPTTIVLPPTPADIITAYQRHIGSAGGRARAAKLSPQRRRKIAAKGGRATARGRKAARDQAES